MKGRARLLRLVGATAAAGSIWFGSTALAASAAAPSYPAGSAGYDVSYPQCGTQLPTGAPFGIVGVTNGLPWSVSPCLGSEYAWAAGTTSGASFYMNTADPGPISSHWTLPGPKVCADPTSYSDTGCAYDYGWNAAAQAFGQAAGATSSTVAASLPWWLDVETGNSWNGSTAANAADVQGSIDYLNSQAVPSVGIYTTAYQWGVITGGYSAPSTPNWVAGAVSQSNAGTECSPSYSFSGGPVTLVQFPSGNFDGDYACSLQPGFSVVASPSSQSVKRGQSASYTLTLTSLNGYSGVVSMKVSGLPSGASGSFSPSSVTPSASGATAKLTVSTRSTTNRGTYKLTITATDGSGVSHTTTVNLTITR